RMALPYIVSRGAARGSPAMPTRCGRGWQQSVTDKEIGSAVAAVLPECDFVAAALLEAADGPPHHLRGHLAVVALVQHPEQRRAPECRRADVECERDQRVELMLVQANVHVTADGALSDTNVGAQKR